MHQRRRRVEELPPPQGGPVRGDQRGGVVDARELLVEGQVFGVKNSDRPAQLLHPLLNELEVDDVPVFSSFQYYHVRSGICAATVVTSTPTGRGLIAQGA